MQRSYLFQQVKPRLVWWFLLLILVICSGQVSRGEDLLPWQETRRMAAPAAHQAAVADRRFVYAVTSHLIEKYDRSSGQLLATSNGPALHLNSGFLWKGQVLSAHSNYPRTPEESEIKILNPQTMQLTTWHSFHDYGGSLTWVVRRHDTWLCNFALYDEKNHQTFLVEFDDDWKELQRWSYPPELIAELGTFSLSGGVWYQNGLLVTGHDKPEVYRVTIPQRGRQLVFQGRAAVPFTGQGIAVDPETVGLVGISRAEKQIIFAEQKAKTAK